MSKKGTLLIAGLAALAYYKYNKMSAEEKTTLKSNLKKQGEKVLESLPTEVKGFFNKVKTETGM